MSANNSLNKNKKKRRKNISDNIEKKQDDIVDNSLGEKKLETENMPGNHFGIKDNLNANNDSEIDEATEQLIDEEVLDLDLGQITSDEQENSTEQDANFAKALRDAQGIIVNQQAKIKELEDNIVSLKEQIMRSMAETENLRKRNSKMVEDTKEYAITEFARSLVEVAENLYRTADNIDPDARSENEQLDILAQGVDMTLREMMNVLEKHGIERIHPPQGEKFNHNYHQAILQIPAPDGAPEGVIMQVVQSGYKIKERLLRPAMVGVAKTAGGNSDDGRGESGGNIDTQI